MSREEKEKLLNEKMENIRKRNEELCKRHQEIEADKKNADAFSSTVTMDKVKPYVMKTPRARTEKAEKPRDSNNLSNLPRPSDIMPSRQRLSEADGPPPDPSYRFLSDPDRDGNEREKKRDGRIKKKGKNVPKGFGEEQEEEGSKEDDDDTVSSPQKEGDGNNSFGNEEDSDNMQWRGRGKDQGKREMGRGRGRGRGFDQNVQNDEGRQNNSKAPYSPREGNDTSRGREKSGLSFASRDIRYFPDDDDDDQMGARQGKMRGRDRRNFNQRKYPEESGHPGDHKGPPGQRGRGRGRGRGRVNDQQREYERWKAERAAIDEARLSRGRTDGGSWRREWDLDKISQGEANNSEPAYDPRYPRSKSSNFKLADLINLPDNEEPTYQAAKKQAKGKREEKLRSSQESRDKPVQEEGMENTKSLELNVVQNASEHVEQSAKSEETPPIVVDMEEAQENYNVGDSSAEVVMDIPLQKENAPENEYVGDSSAEVVMDIPLHTENAPENDSVGDSSAEVVMDIPLHTENAPENDCVEDSPAEVMKDSHPNAENMGDDCSNKDSLEHEKDSAIVD